MNKQNIPTEKNRNFYKKQEGNDYILKRFRLQENRIFKQKGEQLQFQRQQKKQKKSQQISEEDDIVIIPLQLQEEDQSNQNMIVSNNKKQQQLVYVFDQDEIHSQKNQNEQIIIFDDEETTTKNYNLSKNVEEIKKNNFVNQDYQLKSHCNNSAAQLAFKTMANSQINSPYQKKQQIQVQKISFNKHESSEEDRQQMIKGVKITKGELKDNLQITILDKKIFSMAQLPSGITLKCILKRTTSFLNMMSPQFDLYISNGLKHILSAKKYPFRNRQIFKFSIDPVKFNQKDTILAIMHANVSHNIYWLLDQPKRIKQLDLSFIFLVVGYYKLSQIQKNRSFTALLPQTNAKYQLAMQYQQNFLNFSNFKQEIPTHISSLINWQIPPHAVKSTKNFVMADQDDPEYRYLQMNKISEDVFELTIQHPLSPLQAMAIAMTRFDVQLK